MRVDEWNITYLGRHNICSMGNAQWKCIDDIQDCFKSRLELISTKLVINYALVQSSILTYKIKFVILNGLDNMIWSK